MIAFFVPGAPMHRPRQKFTFRAGKPRSYTDDNRVAIWKERIALFGAPHKPKEPLDGPLRVDVYFFMPAPASAWRKPKGQRRELKSAWCDRKPDRDNLDKPILDALEANGFIANDSRVVDGNVMKLYADDEMVTGAYIVVDNAATEPSGLQYMLAAGAAARVKREMCEVTA